MDTKSSAEKRGRKRTSELERLNFEQPGKQLRVGATGSATVSGSPAETAAVKIPLDPQSYEGSAEIHALCRGQSQFLTL